MQNAWELDSGAIMLVLLCEFLKEGLERRWVTRRECENNASLRWVRSKNRHVLDLLSGNIHSDFGTSWAASWHGEKKTCCSYDHNATAQHACEVTARHTLFNTLYDT